MCVCRGQIFAPRKVTIDFTLTPLPSCWCMLTSNVTNKIIQRCLNWVNNDIISHIRPWIFRRTCYCCPKYKFCWFQKKKNMQAYSLPILVKRLCTSGRLWRLWGQICPGQTDFFYHFQALLAKRDNLNIICFVNLLKYGNIV